MFWGKLYTTALSFCDQRVVSSSYAKFSPLHSFWYSVCTAEVRTMTKIWKYLFSYDSPQRNDQTNGHILRFPHISKYLSFLFALFWSVDMPDTWFWVSGWVIILVTVTGNGLVIYFIRTKPGRQILLHSRPHPCWSLFQSQLRLLVLLQHQSLRHDGRPLPCHHKAFAVHVLHDERNCLGNDYYGLDWPISTLLFAFHLHLQSQSDIYHVRGNIPSAHFPDSAPRYLCRCDLSSPSHCLESQPPDTGTDFSSSPQPCYEHECTEHPATCSIQSATQEFHRFDHIGDDRLQYHVPRRELPLSLLSH